MEEENKIATKGALQGAIEGIAGIFERISAALSECISTALLGAKKVVAETLEVTKEATFNGGIKAGGTTEVSDFNSTNGDATLGTTEVYGSFDVYYNDINVHDGNVVAQNITAMQADVDTLKRMVRVTGLKCTKKPTDARPYLRLTIAVDPEFFGDVPVYGSTCKIRVNLAGLDLGTKDVTLVYDGDATDYRAYVKTPFFESGSVSLPSVGQSKSGTLTISTNISGSYENVLQIPVTYTCVAEAITTASEEA